MKQGNQNARKPADARKRTISIMLSPAEREWFAALGGGMIARGIHIAHDALAGARDLVVEDERGNRCRITHRLGHQWAVLDGKPVAVYVWRLQSAEWPLGAGWNPANSELCDSRDPEDWSLFV